MYIYIYICICMHKHMHIVLRVVHGNFHVCASVDVCAEVEVVVCDSMCVNR